MQVSYPKFAFLGCTKFSKVLLEYLVSNSIYPSVIFTIPQEFGISYSSEKVKNTNFSDLSTLAKNHEIPILNVESEDGSRLQDYETILDELGIDLLLVLGWYYMVPKSVRERVKLGAWGIHASLLPNYAGGAPLNWAIINGEKETGVTLFRMEDGVDDGDVIAQERFGIDSEDTISEVYDKATLASKKLLKEVFDSIDAITFTPQNKEDIKVYPQRSPQDGKIDLSMSAVDMYNFIRAQSSPYPGAYIETADGKKIIIEKARIE